MTQNGNITKQAFWVALGSLSSFMLAILSAVILSRYFDKAEYGTYKQILYVYNTLLIVFSAGLPKVFSYYLPRYEFSKGKDIVYRVTALLFVAGLVFSVFLHVFSDLIALILRNQELSTGLKVFSPIPALLLPTLGLEGIFASYGKAKNIAIYNTLSRILMLVFIVSPVLIFQGSYIEATYGWIISSVFCLLVALIMLKNNFKGVKTEKSGLEIKTIFAYSLPLVGASLAGIAIKSSAQFFISRYFGVDEFAEFSNGFIDIPFVGMITGATSVVLMPVFSKLVHEKSDFQSIIELWKRTLLKSAYLIYPIVIFFIVFSPEIINVLFTDLYANSVIYFRIAMVVNFFNIIIFGPLLFSLGETKFYAKLHVFLALVSWIGGFLIVFLFKSPFLLAILTACMPILMVILSFKKMSQIFNVRVFSLIPVYEITKILIHSILCISIVWVFNEFVFDELETIFRLSMDVLLFAVILLGSSKFFRLNYLSVVFQLLKVKEKS